MNCNQESCGAFHFYEVVLDLCLQWSMSRMVPYDSSCASVSVH